MSGLDTIEALTAPVEFFGFGNADPTEIVSELVAAVRSFRAGIAGMGQEFVDIWEIGDRAVVAGLNVHQRRLDGGEGNLLCCTVFRVNDGFVRDCHSYLDVQPVTDALKS